MSMLENEKDHDFKMPGWLNHTAMRKKREEHQKWLKKQKDLKLYIQLNSKLAGFNFDWTTLAQIQEKKEAAEEVFKTA